MVYPFLPVFARALGVDLPAISLVLTTRSLITTMIPFIASAFSKLGRRAGLVAGVGLFTLGVSVSIFWHTYPGFYISQCTAYFGAFLYASSFQAFIGDKVPYEKRGTIIAITETSWALSYIIGMPLVGFAIGFLGWYAPFPALGFAGLAGLFLILRIIPNESPVLVSGEKVFYGLGRIFSSPRARSGLAFSFMMVTANEVVNVVFGVWMETSFGLQLAALGAASAIIGASELFGELSSAGLADRIGKKRAITYGLGGMAVSVLLIPYLGTLGVSGALFGLFLFYLTFEFTVVCSLSLLTEVMPETRAAFMGANVAMISLGRAVGAFIAPLLFSMGFTWNTMVSLVFMVGAFVLIKQLNVKESGDQQQIALT
jgi:predicted MFS family arabinose efflux permease